MANSAKKESEVTMSADYGWQETDLANPEKVNSSESSRKKSTLDFRKYTQQIWLAGLGAFSRAEDEGNRLFDSLVKVGEELEAKTSDIADNTVGVVGEVKDKVTGRVTGARERVERALDERVNSTMSRIGLASHKEMAQLIELIERLESKVDSLTEEVRRLSRKK